MESTGQGTEQTLRKAVIAAAIGNCVEWFDFAVYGFLATYIALNFFPSDDPTVSLLSTFAVFAAAFESLFVCCSLAAGAELFATRVRYGGFSIGYNYSVAIFGGTAPYIATYLVSSTGNPLSPAYYVIAAAVLTLVTILTMRETARAPLAQTTATDAG
jgi:hypothetical protein